MAKKPRKRFDTLGNLDMIKNSVRAIKHHADELTAELKKNPEIEAWVLAKVDRAAQNLSDVTHYLDGEMNKFADGGMMADGGEITKEDCREIFYVMDGTGKVKNISAKREDALSFLQKSLKGDGRLSSRVVLKKDWNDEKINPSNIKDYKEPNVGFYSNDEIWGMDKYGDGGMMNGGEIEAKEKAMELFEMNNFLNTATGQSYAKRSALVAANVGYKENINNPKKKKEWEEIISQIKKIEV